MFPVGDSLRTRTTPFVNWTFIAVSVLVFLYTVGLSTRPDEIIRGFTLSETDRFFLDWGFVPACVGKYFGASVDAGAVRLSIVCPSGDRVLIQPFTAMFVHAGWAHILGNMLFLWIFGDNVEDSMGHGRYLVFYILCGVAAAAAQTYFALDTSVPAVGASGAIAGVLAAYLIMFPTAMIRVVFLPLFFLPLFVPAIVLIGMWFIAQVFSGLATLGTAAAGSGVAWWAHVGGFVAGAVLIGLFRRRRRPRAFV